MVKKLFMVDEGKVKHVKRVICLEGYRISANGRCIKDKNHIPSPKPKTICLKGYKISANGKCIKDKNYKIIVKQTQKSPKHLKK